MTAVIPVEPEVLQPAPARNERRRSGRHLGPCLSWLLCSLFLGWWLTGHVVELVRASS